MTFFSVAFCVVESSLTFALAMSLRLLLVILRVVDLLIDLTGFQQLLVCADAADLASSSTTIWSAWRMEEVRWETMNTVGLSGNARSAWRSFKSVA